MRKKKSAQAGNQNARKEVTRGKRLIVLVTEPEEQKAKADAKREGLSFGAYARSKLGL